MHNMFTFVDENYTQTSFCVGEFNLTVFDRDLNIIKKIQEPNLIVNNAKVIAAKLLGGIGSPITKIGLGTGTNAPTLFDTALTSPTYFDIISVSYPESETWTQFNWYVGYTDLVGVPITEYGLTTAALSLFNRKVYSEIIKSEDMAFSGAWVIKFYQE